MDLITVLAVAGVLLQLLGIGLVKVLWVAFDEVKRRAVSTEKELADYKLHVAENYATTRELSKAIDAINETMKAVFAKLDRIEEKLDHKQDKP